VENHPLERRDDQWELSFWTQENCAGNLASAYAGGNGDGCVGLSGNPVPFSASAININQNCIQFEFWEDYGCDEVPIGSVTVNSGQGSCYNGIAPGIPFGSFRVNYC
jgi:hypothetical protein